MCNPYHGSATDWMTFVEIQLIYALFSRFTGVSRAWCRFSKAFLWWTKGITLANLNYVLLILACLPPGFVRHAFNMKHFLPSFGFGVIFGSVGFMFGCTEWLTSGASLSNLFVRLRNGKYFLNVIEPCVRVLPWQTLILMYVLQEVVHHLVDILHPSEGISF